MLISVLFNPENGLVKALSIIEFSKTVKWKKEIFGKQEWAL